MRAGMGYGFAATGLQIAQAYATLANHGQMVRPRLVKELVTSDGRLLESYGRGGEAPQVVSSEAADAVVRMLGGMMPSNVQTVDGFTGEYSPSNHIASCAGFFPAGRPRYVIAVAFDRPLPIIKGEDAADPAFRAIVEALPKKNES